MHTYTHIHTYICNIYTYIYKMIILCITTRFPLLFGYGSSFLVPGSGSLPAAVSHICTLFGHKGLFSEIYRLCTADPTLKPDCILLVSAMCRPPLNALNPSSSSSSSSTFQSHSKATVFQMSKKLAGPASLCSVAEATAFVSLLRGNPTSGTSKTNSKTSGPYCTPHTDFLDLNLIYLFFFHQHQ